MIISIGISIGALLISGLSLYLTFRKHASDERKYLADCIADLKSDYAVALAEIANCRSEARAWMELASSDAEKTDCLNGYRTQLDSLCEGLKKTYDDLGNVKTTDDPVVLKTTRVDIKKMTDDIRDSHRKCLACIGRKANKAKDDTAE